MSELIYILSPEETYQKAQKVGAFKTDSLRSEGFIHASPYHQLSRVANAYFSAFPRLLLLTVSLNCLRPDVRWEAASSGGLYPHIYGPLNLEAITEVTSVERQPDGLYGFEAN